MPEITFKGTGLRVVQPIVEAGFRIKKVGGHVSRGVALPIREMCNYGVVVAQVASNHLAGVQISLVA